MELQILSQVKIWPRILLDDAREKPLDGSPAKRWEPEAKVFDPRLTVGDRLNAILNANLLGDYRNFNPMASTSVPPFWSIPYREGCCDLASG
jgi:hypothetical protein